MLAVDRRWGHCEDPLSRFSQGVIDAILAGKELDAMREREGRQVRGSLQNNQVWPEYV